MHEDNFYRNIKYVIFATSNQKYKFNFEVLLKRNFNLSFMDEILWLSLSLYSSLQSFIIFAPSQQTSRHIFGPVRCTITWKRRASLIKTLNHAPQSTPGFKSLYRTFVQSLVRDYGVYPFAFDFWNYSWSASYSTNVD